MTTVSLAAAWIGLVVLLRPPRRFLTTLSPAVQAGAALTAMLGMVLIPISIALVTLSVGLSAEGGPSLRACGRLISAIVTHPLASPSVSFSLLVLAAAPTLLAKGAGSAWRSQSACGRIARHAGTDLVIVPTDRPLAFTAGLLRPRVVLSRGLLDSARADLCEVVLSHEEAHRRGRHPLLLFVAETLARAVPIAPMCWGTEALRFALESVADDRAVRKTENRELVAEAIATVALASVSGAAAFEGHVVERVRRLLAPERTVRLRGFVTVAALLAVFAFATAHTGHCAADSAEMLATSQCRLHS